MRASPVRRLLTLLAGLVLAAAPALAPALAGDAPGTVKILPDGQIEFTLPPEDDSPDRVLAPMLWRVTGNGLKEPAYLFGTIHLSDERITGMHPLSRAAFKRAATLHTEIAMDSKDDAAMARALMRSDGKKLNEAIGPELAKQLDAELKAINPALSSAMLQPLKTWAVAVSLGSLEDQLKGGEALDKQLWNKAKRAGKRCEALETMEEHVGGFGTLTEAEQLLFLKAALEAQTREREGKAPVTQAKLVDLYLRGDDKTIGKLDELVPPDQKPTPEEKALEDKITKFLLKDRNVVMAKAIVKECKAHPEQCHFFAAGTAHFAGKDNVRELLEKEGYAIERLGAPEGEKPQEEKPQAPKQAEKK